MGLRIYKVTFNEGDSVSRRDYYISADDMYKAVEQAQILDQGSINRDCRYSLTVAHHFTVDNL